MSCHKKVDSSLLWSIIEHRKDISMQGIQIWPLVGMFAGISIAIPLVFYFATRHVGEIKNLSWKLWLAIFIVALIFFPLFLPRKHWEKAMVFYNSSFWFVAGVVQMDNNFWEELAKLLVFLIFIGLTHKRFAEYFRSPKEATILGYWIGLSYGIGEAVTLTFIALYPKLGQILGISLFLLFINWTAVLERFMAIQLHAIMGALIGLGLFWFIALKRKWWLLWFFVIAMLYHELVDGTVIAMKYFYSLSLFKFLARNIYSVTLPLCLVIGYVVLLLLYRWSVLKKENPKEAIELAKGVT